MKTLITQNLLKFTLSALLFAVIFRFSLSTSIANKMVVGVLLTALFYALLMWFSGYYFGKKDYEQLPIYDIGFRFHLVTYLTHNIVSVVWFKIGFESRYENMSIIYTTALIWSVFLIMHFLYYLSARKSSIKNLKKNELFE
jgi:hypothetical protein